MAEGFRVHGVINAGDAVDFPQIDALSMSVCTDDPRQCDGLGVWKIEFTAVGAYYGVGLLGVYGSDKQAAVDRWKWIAGKLSNTREIFWEGQHHA